jgi:hypothetical protein
MAAVVVTRHGLQGPRQAQYTVNVRINVDGRAHLFGGRVGARRRGEYPGQPRRLFIFEASVAGNFAGLVAAMGTVYRLGGYHGRVDHGVALTGVRGAYSETLLQRQVGFFEESFAYNSDGYYRHERVAAEQQYVAKLKCLCKVGLGSVGVAATPAAEATASPGRAIERSGWPARTARSMPR